VQVIKFSRPGENGEGTATEQFLPRSESNICEWVVEIVVRLIIRTSMTPKSSQVPVETCDKTVFISTD
jgi:hypothetical protein